MFCEDVCFGVSGGLDRIRNLNDAINAKVVDEVNGNQELVMLTSFAVESNEYHFKKCLQDRISDVKSWRWVLEDLSKRLCDVIEGLKYEHNALRVVVQRIQGELNYHCGEASRPGAICPLSDVVEEAIMQECEFLRHQRKYFEKLIMQLDKQISLIEKTKKKIENDVFDKNQSLSIDETCIDKHYEVANLVELKKRKKGSPVSRWLKRCSALKRVGLKALCNAVVTRQQVRGARMHLSISAQAYVARIDAVLRRRLHTNRIKIQDLKWQRDEALQDYKSLEEELALAEKTLIETMERESIIEARLRERSRRPNREQTKDDANRKLRDEQSQLRKLRKELKKNIESINSLQNDLSEAITHIDCCAEDIMHVIRLDEDRVHGRKGEQAIDSTIPAAEPSKTLRSETGLPIIREEDEDNYPFDF